MERRCEVHCDGTTFAHRTLARRTAWGSRVLEPHEFTKSANRIQQLIVPQIRRRSHSQDVASCIDVDAALSREHARARMILTVHDELLFEAPEVEADAVAAVVRAAMASAVQLRVPLDVDVGIGLNWKEAKA